MSSAPRPVLLDGAMDPDGGFRAACAEVRERGGRVLRAWPRSAGHLLLEVAVAGRAVAAQWHADPVRALSVAEGTPGATVRGRLVLQPGGADRRLRGLRELLDVPGSELVAHRPERRAVVRTGAAGPVAYVKAVRRDRLPALVQAARDTGRLPVRTPRVEHVDRARGHLWTAALPGRPLHELLATADAAIACRALGEALAALHALPVPDRTPEHDAAAEAAVLRRWAGLAQDWGLAGAPEVDGVTAALTDRPSGGRVLVHRDLHDRQVLVDGDGSVGLLDFDLLAAGEPALDLANLLVHLDLRQEQGVLPAAAPLRDAVLAGYDPSAAVLARVPVYAAATRLRLAAVYAFRPGARAG